MVNVEEMLIDYLSGKTTYRIAAELSNPRVEDVTLETTSGVTDSFTNIKNVSIAIQSYGNSRHEASVVAYNIHSALQDIADEVVCVHKAVIGVPYVWTDREPRYQMTLDLTIV